MTNEEQKLREFADKWGYLPDIYKYEPEDAGVTITMGTWHRDKEGLLSDLTALISEGYVSKEEHEKMKHDLTHCGSCGDPLSRDCQRCKHLWET